MTNKNSISDTSLYDPERHPYLIRVLNIIKQMGGKNMKSRCNYAMSVYLSHFDPNERMSEIISKQHLLEKFPNFWNKMRSPNLFTNKFEDKISILQFLGYNKDRAYSAASYAALADHNHCILKDRLFWNEIIMLKLKFGALSGTSAAPEIQSISNKKIWKIGLNAVSLNQLSGVPVYMFSATLSRAIHTGDWNEKAHRELCQILKYIENGTVCYERLCKERFGGKTENDTIRRSVVSLLGGSRSTSTAFRASGKGVPSLVDGDAGIVRAFAEYRCCWHDKAIGYIRQFGAKFHAKGKEARVYLSKDESFVYKIKNDVSHNLLKFYDEIINHNILFPDTEYVILGFGLDEHGRFCTILKQDAINGRPATPKEIENHFLNLGFEKISDTAYKQGSYIVSDLKPSNVVYSKGKCFVIDCFAQNIFDFDNNFYINSKNLSGFNLKTLPKPKFQVGDYVRWADCPNCRPYKILEIKHLLSKNDKWIGYMYRLEHLNAYENEIVPAISPLLANEIAILKLEFGK